ncbi:MAG: response regulator transcription factor [Firmicutes bacterium]|nr:response regulator transcription factor [Bacillota bacterium]
MDNPVAPPRVLLVEDDAALAGALREYLSGRGFAVETVFGGEAAVDRLARGEVDLVVLDLMLPDLDGYAVARAVRDMEAAPTPVLMLTARSESRDKLRGFAAGADDYVVKPFDPDELVARMRALLRRTGRAWGEPQHLGPVAVDRARRRLSLGERTVYLSPREFDLLETLAAVPGRPLSRSELVARAWGVEAERDDRTVDTTVARLRRKLESLAPAGRPPVAIATLWGVGYRLDVSPP